MESAQKFMNTFINKWNKSENAIAYGLLIALVLISILMLIQRDKVKDKICTVTSQTEFFKALLPLLMLILINLIVSAGIHFKLFPINLHFEIRKGLLTITSERLKFCFAILALYGVFFVLKLTYKFYNKQKI